jgi:hypothetical protein
MSTHIAFFYGTVIASVAVGLGCLAAALYFEFVGESRMKKDIHKDDVRRVAGRRRGAAIA